MITTNEAITDPLQFVQADPALLRHIETDDGLVIASPNIDVCVSRSTLPRDTESSVSFYDISPILGPLYRQGSASGVYAQSDRIDITWYSSPDKTNQLVEQLGLRPGIDVLRFVHAALTNMGRDPTIPAKVYAATHLAAGEYPESTEALYFDHDRGRGHAVGVLLCPPLVTSTIIEKATPCRRERGSIKVAGAFDVMSDTIEGMSRQLWPYVEGSAPDKLDREQLRFIAGQGTLADRPSFVPYEAKNKLEELLGIRPDDRITLVQTVYEHLLELMPAIYRLRDQKESVSAG